MRLIAAVNVGVGADLPVGVLFEAPTVAQLAPRIAAGGRGLDRLVAGDRPAEIPLSFAQSRLWFLDQLQGPSPVYNMPVVLRLRGHLDVDALGAAMADVVDRHESLRTRIVAPDGVPRQLVLAPEDADFGWEVVDADGWSPARLQDAVADTARRSFDLEAEIPLSAKLFRVSVDEHLLVGVLHHIAADGWSIVPLVRDLGQAYEEPPDGRRARMVAAAGAVRGLHPVATRTIRRSRRQ